MKNIPQEIRILLAQKGMKEAQLAKKIGVTPQNLNERLKGEDIKASLLEKIAQALEIPVNYFFDEKIPVPLKSNGTKQKVFVHIELEDGIDESKILKLFMGKEFINLLKK